MKSQGEEQNLPLNRSQRLAQHIKGLVDSQGVLGSDLCDKGVPH